MKINVVTNILDANNRIANENRAFFDEKQVFVLNLMSSPGAGKTSLVEKTIVALKKRYNIGVIEGDIQDSYDAERIAKLNIPVVQINTGGACHLDGNMIKETFPNFNFDNLDLLITENVGNLVCPAEFKIGENAKIMLLSTPEGADKPAKYPLMFAESSVLLLNKMDLAPYVDFDLKKARHDALAINPELEIFEISCKDESGLQQWFDWLVQSIEKFRQDIRD